MNYAVYVRRAAERDVLRAQRWYEQQQPGLAAQFHDELARVLVRLEITPLIYPVLYRDIRRAVLSRFPYLIWYVIRDSKVIVLACTHAHMAPERLPERLR